MNEKTKQNIWNFISALGTVATLIFGFVGIFLVPSYVNDAYHQKQIQANKEIITDLQELFYSNEAIDSKTVSTLKRGKEIKINVAIPYSLEEILVEVQESFIDNKFLDLKNRKEIYNKIDSIKHILPKEQSVVYSQKAENKTVLIIIYIASAISLIISIMLFLGLLSKRKQQVNDEFQKKYEEIEESKPDSIITYRNFENKVCEILNKLKLTFEDFTQKPSVIGFDFIVQHNKKRIGIEVKSRVNTDILMKLRHQYDKSGLDALIIISNRLVDFNTFSLLTDLKEKISGRPIYFISGIDSGSIEKELMKILNVEIK
jgi:hypothetical protein